MLHLDRDYVAEKSIRFFVPKNYQKIGKFSLDEWLCRRIQLIMQSAPSGQASGPGFFIKAGWESHEEQASKQHTSMPSASVSACLQVPDLPSLDDESDTDINSFLPSLLMVLMFYHSKRSLLEIFSNTSFPWMQKLQSCRIKTSLLRFGGLPWPS